MSLRLSLLVITFSTIALDAAAQPLTVARDDYASYAGARGIAAADFDRNGLPDLAHANTGRNTVTILLNHRDTRLVRAFDVSVGTGPFDLASADFNRDGIPDLAVANADSHSISILLGAGNGSFTRLPDIPTPWQNPRGLAAADVNKDGNVDVIYTGFATGAVRLLLGAGTGAFTQTTAYAGPSASRPQGVAAADINRDGLVDLVVACDSTAGLRVLFGNPDGLFSPMSVVGDTYLNVVATGDLNGDGWTDVAAASTRNSIVSVALGGPDGLHRLQFVPTGASPRGIAIADVNADGAPDVVTANRASSTVSVFLWERGQPGALLPDIEFAAGAGSRDVVVADFDADGRLDLATGNEYGANATVLSNRTAFERAGFVFGRIDVGSPSRIFAGPSGVWTADFNRDGRLDVLTLARQQPWTLSVVLTGGPTVSLPGDGGFGFAVGDFNTDGNPDVLYKTCCPATATFNVYLGDGAGAFSPPRQSESALPGTAFAIGDMNGDARPDLATLGWANGQAFLQTLMGRGDGTFAAGVQAAIDTEWGTDIRLVDFNRDGKLDVAVLLEGGRLQIWPGDGRGGVSAPAAEVTFVQMPAAGSLAFGDLNGDAYPDVVVSGWEQLGVAMGSGGAIGPPFYMPAEPGPCCSPVSLADLDANGTLDIIAGGGRVFEGNGDGTFRPSLGFEYGGEGLEVADFTGDGLPDILFGTSLGEVGVLVNERNAVNRAPAVTAGPDATIPYEYQAWGEYGEGGGQRILAMGTDPDQHAISFEWRDAAGAIVSTSRDLVIWKKRPGTYSYTVRVEDGRGGVITDTVAVTIEPTKEIVLHLWDDTVGFGGHWSAVGDLTAAGNTRGYSANLGAPKVTAPLASPVNGISLGFIPDPTQTYKLWVRLKADRDLWSNDSIWIQLSGATDLSGTPRYRPGTTSGLSVSLEECINCGVSGWGWEDDGWGAYNRNGVLLRFPEGGEQHIVIQTREDGVSIDQIVLSAERYLTARPGAAKNDWTILPRTYRPY